jgi:transposase
METAATRPMDPRSPALFMALELSKREWKIAFTVGRGQRPRLRTVPAGDRERLQAEVSDAKRRFHLPPEARVRSCYEAGRESFWVHRMLTTLGIDNQVVDSSSIEVSRRKRIKTDPVDAEKLVDMLIRYLEGERRVWKVVRVPSQEDEDLRHVQRELIATRRDRGRSTSRIKAMLFTQGVPMECVDRLPEWLPDARGWNGSVLLEGLRARVLCEWEKWSMMARQESRLEAERTRVIAVSTSPAVAQQAQLCRLRGIGIETAWLLAIEFFSWRCFRNVRQLAAAAGLAATPYRSGDMDHELGISKSGNRLVRWIMVEAAWRWLRWQPESELSLWYQSRYGKGSKRVRKIGIVALARKLLIALWKYVEQDVVPAGAVLKS